MAPNTLLREIPRFQYWFSVNDGPGRWDFLMSCVDIDPLRRRRVVGFHLTEHRDGSARTAAYWNATIESVGRCEDEIFTDLDEAWAFTAVMWGGCFNERMRVEGIYSTKTRKGCCRIAQSDEAPTVQDVENRQSATM